MINLLGIKIENNHSFKEHIKRKCKVAMYNLHNIRSLSEHLNAIFSTLLASTIRCLIRVQNLAAKLVLNSRDRDTTSTNAKQILHWLPIKERSIYKCLTILHPCVHGYNQQSD